MCTSRDDVRGSLCYAPSFNVEVVASDLYSARPQYYTCLMYSYWAFPVVFPYYSWVGPFRLIPLHKPRRLLTVVK